MPTWSHPVASAASASTFTTAASSKLPTQPSRSSRGIDSWPAKGSGATTTQPFSSARRSAMVANSGRRPMMSGQSTRPWRGWPSPGGAYSAGVPPGSSMRMALL